MQSVIAMTNLPGLGKASIDCIKKANDLITISAVEHYESYQYLSPFLKAFKNENNGFQYKIERDPLTYEFQRVAILFSYSVKAFKYCYKVLGVDASFCDSFPINGTQRKDLEKIVETLPFGIEVKFKQCCLIGLSGRTVNNEMIIFGFLVSYRETKEDYLFFFKFINSEVYI